MKRFVVKIISYFAAIILLVVAVAFMTRDGGIVLAIEDNQPIIARIIPIDSYLHRSALKIFPNKKPPLRRWF
ncbi:MAG: hypothetical protein COV55_01785 [Candidatus Komeilibacteria bacterium CG11_big_fil_rev_8_21_14_0_20_36_20]|uniref:Uncharacterized protein n=1 Tax=Candidatus Komeilibacteria bacterium CG11_big_fil_rev_8_21_14_0_20_36_20 TaxID=1974477 RepID=A0A2H0NE24_9BACT|nr:MAG: hypothetical protein COV55_01785 [Candidatus Komeilibacteria bacterium CG11_big_fil_rev_8_21_14_0_20_36_20]PIR81274.1 MAG: hypothetical protein COU21_04770 [Candidatus Komeilibacteria bacterium CG10_big_fil_rev_8_21_14_0_10_36_65]PJC55238.1 MAG: hypothetical protein CO027_03710 [Candidatus Komeilibacteria bacterium CG_4_9_14_0_2_um_filter_36_13]